MFLSSSEIVSEICKVSMHSMGIGEQPDIEKLKPLSLQMMLDAVCEVEKTNREKKASADGKGHTFQVVPDDRLTAAVYTWLHYCAPGMHDAGDPDDSIVYVKINGVIHGLVMYARRVG